MYRKFSLSIALVDQYGRTHAARMVELGPEVITYGDRYVDELKMGLIPTAEPMEEIAKVLHERKLRKDLLADAARLLGYQLADYLEDSEGWNGEDRRDIIRGRR